jgi:hypothetical protein
MLLSSVDEPGVKGDAVQRVDLGQRCWKGETEQVWEANRQLPAKSFGSNRSIRLFW